MNYILIYDKVEHLNIILGVIIVLIIALISGLFIFPRLKKDTIKVKLIITILYIISILWMLYNVWSEAQNIIERIATQRYSIAEGKIEGYVPSDNYNREKGYFWVNQHKFFSETTHGFTSDLYLDYIVLKNGNNVKIYYIGNKILKFWIEDPIPILIKDCTNRKNIACSKLAKHYHKGIMVDVNLTKALDLYSKACNGGEKKACTSINRIKNKIRYLKNQKIKESLENEKKAEKSIFHKPVYDID